jgi:hypothetical protein
VDALVTSTDTEASLDATYAVPVDVLVTSTDTEASLDAACTFLDVLDASPLRGREMPLSSASAP